MNNIRNLKNTLTLNYVFLILGNSTSKLGTVIYQTILAWWLVEKTDSAKAFGYISFASLLPIVLFNFFSGVIVDKFNRKKLLIISDIVSGLTCISIAYIAFLDIINIPLLILASFLLGASSAIFGPASKAILPEIVNKDSVANCNSITSTIGQIIGIAAPMIAGFLLKDFSIGIAFIFLINGLTFLISALCESFLKYNFSKTKNKKDTYWSALKEGFHYTKKHKWLINLLIVSAIVNIFIAPYNVLLPLYLKRAYLDNIFLYSQSLTAEAIGGVLGGMMILFSKNKISNQKMLATNIFFCGLSAIFMQVFINKYILLISIFSFSLFLTRFNVLFFSLVQTTVEKNMLGRVFSIIIMISLSTMPISNLIFGYLGDYMLDYVYIMSGIGICFASMLSILNFNLKPKAYKNSLSD
ncbi:MFS transporter [Bacillus cereus group sp. BfR-BA-01441]|uniref:MFS transporter n=1 Tax=Bacillus cereus group sp. BfR-BA-01441 TaxID=2920348 RepID=UPI001F59BFAC